jgi:hypothetical protein
MLMFCVFAINEKYPELSVDVPLKVLGSNTLAPIKRSPDCLSYTIPEI